MVRMYDPCTIIINNHALFCALKSKTAINVSILNMTESKSKLCKFFKYSKAKDNKNFQ